jgi:FKBP-type peptidyl-prolyl cis-trans isomerase FkpA
VIVYEAGFEIPKQILMRNLVWCLIGFVLLSGGCLKDNNRCEPNGSVAPAAEVQAVQDYISNNSITATKHSSGLFYNIVSSGDGTAPNVCSTIKVDFTGKLTNGTQVESDHDIHINLKFLVPGWQIGMPLIKPGGRIKLYLPPSLGYGSAGKKDSAGNVVVQPNSILIYDISLKLVE